jgi:hypothetical protein
MEFILSLFPLFRQTLMYSHKEQENYMRPHHELATSSVVPVMIAIGS